MKCSLPDKEYGASSASSDKNGPADAICSTHQQHTHLASCFRSSHQQRSVHVKPLVPGTLRGCSCAPVSAGPLQWQAAAPTISHVTASTSQVNPKLPILAGHPCMHGHAPMDGTCPCCPCQHFTWTRASSRLPRHLLASRPPSCLASARSQTPWLLSGSSSLSGPDPCPALGACLARRPGLQYPRPPQSRQSPDRTDPGTPLGCVH
mmetsp:Transcript_27645/g.70422  ORF Transcript_27645/g.70422 Transcript_27645/m.70422 type:complete len:206 (+) Transcript_27645:70-687(+)